MPCPPRHPLTRFAEWWSVVQNKKSRLWTRQHDNQGGTYTRDPVEPETLARSITRDPLALATSNSSLGLGKVGKSKQGEVAPMTSLVYTPRAQRSHVDQTTKHTVSTDAANYARSQWPQNSHGAQYAQTSLRPHVPRRFRGKTNQALPKRNWPRVPGISLEGSGIPSGEPLALWGVSQVVALRAPKVFAPLRTLGAIVIKAMTHQLRIETARSSKGMLPSRSKRSIANTPHQTLSCITDILNGAIQ